MLDAGAGFFDKSGIFQQQGGARHAIQSVGLGFAVPPQVLHIPLSLFCQHPEILGFGRPGQAVSAINVILQNQAGDEFIQVADEATFVVVRLLGANPARGFGFVKAQKLYGL